MATKTKKLSPKMEAALARLQKHGKLRRTRYGWVVPQPMDGSPLVSATDFTTVKALVRRDLVCYTEYLADNPLDPTECALCTSFKVEVQADSTGTWASNALRFETREKADAYAKDLWSRWMAVKEWRVVGSPDPVNEGRRG